jgi:phosphoglycerol transferase MdoB-like AlkP superfamily enzyme
LHFLPSKIQSIKSVKTIFKTVFYLFNLPFFLINTIDFAYYGFTFKRTTADFLNFVKTGDDVLTLLPQYVKDYWYLLLILIALIILTEYLYQKTAINGFYKSSPLSFKKALIRIVGIIGMLFLAVLGIRGGLQYKPLGILNAGQFTLPSNAALVLNSSFTFIKTFDKEQLTEKKYFNNVDLGRYYNPIHQNKNGILNKTNVVVIILESFGKEYFGGLNTYNGYTHFLDSLMKESLVFPNAISNGKRSIEGIPAILASIPTLMDESFITSSYAVNSINSTASVLHKNGYKTAFYHGGNNGTMGFDIFTKAAGFDNYYGRTEYNNDKDYDGNWGIFDEPFFQYFAKNTNAEKQPFFNCIFSLSSHHPYTLPAKYKNVFKGGKLPIYSTVQYADYALKQYFATASKMSWFKNTLFVITPDHTSLSERAFYKTSVGMYSIPIIFYKPDSDLKGIKTQTIQQTDIMPSILEYVGINEAYLAFGKSIFDTTTTHFAVNYIAGNYQIIENEYALQFNGNETVSLYNYQKDSLLLHNLKGKSFLIQQDLETKLKAEIQQYNNRLIKNRLLPN